MHAMQSVSELGMKPVNAGGDTLKAGKTTAGFTLYEAFAISAQNDARVLAISSLVAAGLTFAEFDSAVADSISQAAAADKLAGWNPPAEAKGRDKYGPKQNTMVQRATEMRQIFGYLKQTHADMHAGGYLETLKAARAWLKDKGITWDGGKKATDEERAASKQTAALAEATKQAMLTVPKNPGEPAGEWFARVATVAQRLVDVEAIKAREAKLQKVVEDLADTWDVSDLYTIGLSLVSHAIRVGYATHDGVATDIKDVQPEEASPV